MTACSWPTIRRVAVVGFLLVVVSRLHAADDSLAAREEAAVKAAVEYVAPSVVRIETIGGLEQVGTVLFGSGPTTGLIATADGYIVSSAFNFAQKPASILVTLPSGARLPAKLVATDHSRMLVLLKVEPSEPLSVPEMAPEKEIRIGQWSIAVGRTFEGPVPNLSMGIVSAVRRVWGKAIQTDAKISPNNYGGPLVDVRGRVLGVLVPLSPQGTSAVAGVEWYDSGIGFAVPWEHVLRVLPRWKEGIDLHPGVLGVSFKAGHQFADPAVLAACRINSPADKAGLKVGDTIVAIDGHEVSRQSQVKEQVTPRYAGETIKVVVLRDKDRLERDVTLVEKLKPYAHPFLGFLPMRDAPTAEVPLMVRYVYPNGPADKAGLKPGDVVTAFNEQKVGSRADLVEKLASVEPGDEVSLTVARKAQTEKLVFKAGTIPGEVPPELPPARQSLAARENEASAVGRFEQKIAEFNNSALVYVPQGYQAAAPHGVVVHLSGDGTLDADAVAAKYQPLCDALDLILVAPQTVPPADAKARRRWDPTRDVAFIGKLLEELGTTYKIDRTRVAVHGYQGGGALGYLLAARHRDWIRGVAAIDALPAQNPPENEPSHRLAYYLGQFTQGTTAATREAAVDRLQVARHPVTVRTLGEEPRPVDSAELAEIIRWIDTLDRL